MGLSGEAVSIVKLVTDAIAIGCCALRWYILRDKQSKGTLLSHYLFTFCITCEVAATVISSIVLLSGDAYIDEHGLSAGQKYLLDEWVLMMTFWAHLLYYLAECVLKAAYLAFYTDLYSRVQTRRRMAIWIAAAVWAASYLCAFGVLFFYCGPFEQNWKPDGTNPRCPVLFNVPTFFILAGANILSDIAILIVPLLIISSMSLGRTEKVSLALVFSIGTISIAASCIRAGLVGERFVTANHTWDTVWQWMLWSHAEIFFGVIAFTLPSFRHILLRGIKKIASSNGKSGFSSSGLGAYGSRMSSKIRANPGGHNKLKDRGGVLVETTVTLKEETTDDFGHTGSETELTMFGEGKNGKGQQYGWHIDPASRSRKESV